MVYVSCLDFLGFIFCFGFGGEFVSFVGLTELSGRTLSPVSSMYHWEGSEMNSSKDLEIFLNSACHFIQ